MVIGKFMKITEKLQYIQDNHFPEWLAMRQKVLQEFSDRQSMFCVCRRLATGLHESNCRTFQNKVTSATVKRLGHLIPKKANPALTKQGLKRAEKLMREQAPVGTLTRAVDADYVDMNGDSVFKEVSQKELQEALLQAIEGGWLPGEVRDRPCSCHINPPCSRCCLDGNYEDEFAEEFNYKVI